LIVEHKEPGHAPGLMRWSARSLLGVRLRRGAHITRRVR
jgi:hypothetical protein